MSHMVNQACQTELKIEVGTQLPQYSSFLARTLNVVTAPHGIVYSSFGGNWYPSTTVVTGSGLMPSFSPSQTCNYVYYPS